MSNKNYYSKKNIYVNSSNNMRTESSEKYDENIEESVSIHIEVKYFNLKCQYNYFKNSFIMPLFD